MIIGISGTFGSGKDSLAEYLYSKYNLLHISTSDIVREFARKQYSSTDRPILRKVANELRQSFGPAAMVDKSFEKYKNSSKKYNGLLISGVRTIGEANKIHQLGGIMVFVDAPIDVRYKRIIQRKRDEEANVSFEEYKKREEAELNRSNRDNVQNLNAVRDICDLLLINNKTKEDFYETAEKGLKLK